MKKIGLLLSLITGCVSAQEFVNPSFEDWDTPCHVDQVPYGWFNYSTWGEGLERYELGCPYSVIAAADGVNYGGAISGNLNVGKALGKTYPDLSSEILMNCLLITREDISLTNPLRKMPDGMFTLLTLRLV